MTYSYNTVGTCAQKIIIDIDENEIIKDVQFLGGCNGNLQGISSLVRGMNIDDAISKLKGIKCGMKSTSCPDQLAKALEAYKQEQTRA